MIKLDLRSAREIDYNKFEAKEEKLLSASALASMTSASFTQ